MTRSTFDPVDAQSRRSFLKAAAAGLAIPAFASAASGISLSESSMKFGLVTYLWGQDMDLPTVIDACEKTGLAGVELRTEHKHAVEPKLSKAERAEVRKRFEASKVTLVGYGSNAQFHEDDPAKVEANIELAKQYIQLMHDCGGSGVKVKPNAFVQGVPREKTIEQIGKALNVVGEYGQKYGQQIRVEVHGTGTSELPVMKAIMDVADHAAFLDGQRRLIHDSARNQLDEIGRFGDLRMENFNEIGRASILRFGCCEILKRLFQCRNLLQRQSQ